MRPPDELKLIYLGCAAPEADDFTPSERSYPGNKAGLLSFLDRVVRAKAHPLTSIADLFAGSGTVAVHFAEAGARVIANDLRYSSYLTNCAFLLSHAGNVDKGKLRQIATYLAALPARPGPLARRSTPLLGPELAGKVQACRTAIGELRAGGRLTEQEERVLVAALLQAVDRATDSRQKGGRLPLRLPRLGNYRDNAVFNRDARQLIREVEAEVVYLDPPLGQEPEADRLALLDEVARGGSGGAAGQGRLAPSLAPLDDWAEAERATRALADLIARARCRHLFLSYSSEGVIPNRTIWDLLKTRGRPECFELEHGAASAAGSGRVTERLFYCALQPLS
ncbi:MAG: DNA adenine methylase [Bacillota bacterium]|nr:DNA adenine methylase [Bacillota bacterium]